LKQQIEIDLRLIKISDGLAVLAESVSIANESQLRSAAALLAGKIDAVYQQENTKEQ